MNDQTTGDLRIGARHVARLLLRLACLACGFWSCAIAAFGMAWMIQVYFDHIPEGKIVSTGWAKGGVRVHLDNGADEVFPNWFGGVRKPISEGVKLDRHGMLQLVPGDTVAKPAHGFVYSVNGLALTDLRWELDRAFLDEPWPTLFVLFVTLAFSYVLVAPGGELMEFNKPPDPAVSLRSLGLAGVVRKGLVCPMRIWLTGAVAIFLFLEIVTRFLLALTGALFGKA